MALGGSKGQSTAAAAAASTGAGDSDEVIQARITTRGAKAALADLARRFGPMLFREVPKLWTCMAAPLTEVFPGKSPGEQGYRVTTL